jgi:hypothetical protein
MDTSTAASAATTCASSWVWSRIAEGVFELLRELEPRAQTPERYVAALPTIGKELVRGVDYVVRRLGPGHGRIELIEDTTEPSMTGCVATLGFIERSLVRVGARDVEVNLLGCRAISDAAAYST